MKVVFDSVTDEPIKLQISEGEILPCTGLRLTLEFEDKSGMSIEVEKAELIAAMRCFNDQ